MVLSIKYVKILTLNALKRNISKVRNLNFLISNLLFKDIVVSLRPIGLRSSVTDGIQCDLKAMVVQFVDELVVGVFMVDVESSSCGATVPVSATEEDLAVGLYVSRVDVVTECECDELEKKNI